MEKERVVHAIQDDYPEEYAWCYGCGRLNEDGLHVRTGWEGDETVSYYLPRDCEIGIPGFVFGGLIASILDCHSMASAGLTMLRKQGFEPGEGEPAPRFVTASLYVDYLKPTPHGVTLKLVSKVEEVHPKRYRVHTEVIADGEVCAKSVAEGVTIPSTFAKK